VCKVVISSLVPLHHPMFTCEVIGKLAVDLIVIFCLGFAAGQVSPARVALVDRKTNVFFVPESYSGLDAHCSCSH
jgi:hypothetical protein